MKKRITRRSGSEAADVGEPVSTPSALPAVKTELVSKLPVPEGIESHDPLLTKVGTPIACASLIFDSDWYQRQYPDVAAASMDPVQHYFDNGSREGRNPNRYFDTNWYASNNPDVAVAGLNPFLHYLLYGAREGRKPAP